VAQHLEDWMNRKWRPAMGWMYFVVCITDFIIFPVVWTAFHSTTGLGIEPWDPLTLKGGGLFHVAMGAVLGIAVWSRGQEKLHGVAAPETVRRESAREERHGDSTKSRPRGPHQEPEPEK
jgi:hypothetical protein